MPFDFLEYKIYTIDYDSMFEEFNSKRILNDCYMQNEYLKVWKRVLQSNDNTLVNQLSTKQAIIELQLKLNSEPEIFQLPIDFSKTQVLLHFRASIANQIVEESKPKSLEIPIEEFLRKDSVFKWSPVETNVESYANCDKPIIAVPFLDRQYNYLIIDGNHRLTYKTRNEKGKVNAFIISERSVIEHSIFSSFFDKHFYIMLNELVHMGNATIKENIDAMELIEKSFLTDGNFKFDF